MSDGAVVFTNVGYVYPGGTRALEGISLRVEPGEMLAVVGPNGGGKSTLVKVMLGLLGGYSGEVRVFGRSPGDARRAGLIGYVPQRSEAELTFPISARQAVMMAGARHVPGWRRTPRAVHEVVDRALEQAGATAFASEPIGSLSGGQVQRVLIARALALEPKILALDEPLVGIDAPGQQKFGALLARLRSELGLTIVIVSHDLRTIAGSAAAGRPTGCDRVACLRRTLHFHSAPGGITPQVLAEVFQHDLADIFGDVHIDAHKAAECGHDHTHGMTPGVVGLQVSAPGRGGPGGGRPDAHA